MMNHLKVHFQVYVLKTVTIKNRNKNDNNKNIYLECATFLKTKYIFHDFMSLKHRPGSVLSNGSSFYIVNFFII
jgi:hypothetical protein